MSFISGISVMHILGIHADKPHFRAAHIRSNRHGIEILSLKDVKQIYIPDFRGVIVSGLAGSDLLIKNMTLKMGNQRHLQEALRFQLETTSYLNPADVLTVPIFRSNKNQSTEVTYFTALKETIRSHLAHCSSNKIDPDRVSAVPQALMRYSAWKYPELKRSFLIDLGSNEWSCLWVENGRIKKSFALAGGIEELLGALWEDRKKTLLQKEVEGVGKQIDLLQLKPHLNPHLSEKLEAKRKEIAMAIFSFARETESCRIIFSGRTDSFVHIREYLLQSFRETVSEEKELPMPAEEDKYAISIGLALEETAKGGESVQFLREDFFPRKNWKKAGLNSLLLFAASIICSGALLLWSQNIYKQKSDEIIFSLEHLLNRSDPDLKKEILIGGASPAEVVQRWIKAIEKSNKDDLYFVTVPKVAEVIHWLSHQGTIASFQQIGDPFEWKEMRYHLVNYPKIGSASEKYKAQVEIEFSVKSPMNARKFHEALLKGDSIVDENQTIGWEVLPHGYKATFFLKSRKSHAS